MGAAFAPLRSRAAPVIYLDPRGDQAGVIWERDPRVPSRRPSFESSYPRPG